MIKDFNIDKEFILRTAKEILEFDSPTGFCFEIINKIEQIIKSYGYKFERTNKGNGVITIEGNSNEKVVGLCAHVDTLGAMVRSITTDGTLKFTILGGPIVPTLDSEYCKIRTRDGRIYSGTFLSNSPSAHVYEDSKSKARDEKNMEVRIDELVHNKEDVLALGILPGDFIFIDPKTTITNSGFIKSRFIDDKGSVSAIIGLFELMSREKVKPKYTTKILISTYEEVGHGSAYIPSDISELIAVDMGCIGDDLSCSEYQVSICAKDSSGPYDYNMTTKLINLAKENNIDYAVDIYPMYGSDVSAALRAGNDIRGALIGPGVHASHGMERTHYKALENTIKLLIAYLI
ncbi:M42 family metallopeptidase [Clostridium botulinum]|nr:aminopeptidase [Clostridium botulinum]MBY6803370.1 M42 family metallopeptidase [Clostridium botulinum]MBY6813915.1 M42 family metallopeptidase [Clostridium botulinum]MBY6820144.1 M42 family metallopeptidase [Clostridium botulinum]NFJ52557.1 M42 family metallopeptidase [Clostridium botulinum]